MGGVLPRGRHRLSVSWIPRSLNHGGHDSRKSSLRYALMPMVPYRWQERSRLIDMSASAGDTQAGRSYALKIVAIHEDSLPWEWTTQVNLRAARLLGPDSVHLVHYTVTALNEPTNRQGAHAAAIEADILVVSVCAARELPLNVHLWIDSWLPHRRRRPGALVAILGLPHQPNRFPARIRKYLHDVARLAHLDFLPQERRLPTAGLGFAGVSTLTGSQRYAGNPACPPSSSAPSPWSSSTRLTGE